MAFDAAPIAKQHGKGEQQKHERAPYRNSHPRPPGANSPSTRRPPQWRPDLIESLDFAGCSSVGRSAFHLPTSRAAIRPTASMCGVGSRSLAARGAEGEAEAQAQVEVSLAAGKSCRPLAWIGPSLASPSFPTSDPPTRLVGSQGPPKAHRSARRPLRPHRSSRPAARRLIFVTRR